MSQHEATYGIKEQENAHGIAEGDEGEPSQTATKTVPKTRA